MKIDFFQRDDLEEVLTIERLNSPNPLDRKDFLSMIDDDLTVCMVAREGSIVGFFIYEMYDHYLSVFILQTHPNHTNLGYGTAMLDELKAKIVKHKKRKFLFSQVRESNLHSLNFAKKRGFSAIFLNKEAYSEPEEDGIALKWEDMSKDLMKEEEIEELHL